MTDYYRRTAPPRNNHFIDWGSACGRYYLEINGIAVAMEGDPIRDDKLMESGLKVWNKDAIFSVVQMANGKVTNADGTVIADFKDLLKTP